MRADPATYRRVTGAALIFAPLLFLVVNVMHPKEFSRGHQAEQLAEIAANYTRWQLAHFLTFVVLMVFVFVVCGLAWLLYERRPERALVGAAFSLIGLACITGVLALDGFTWGVLGELSTRPGLDPRTVQAALTDIQESEWNLPFYVGSLSWLIGLVILAWGLIRERLIPAPAGGTFALGAVLVGIEAGVQDNVYFIVAAAVLAAGGVMTGWAILRAR